jgi:selenide,water dikinase
MENRLPKSVIALLGVGHTNAHVVRMWKMRPVPGAELVCVSNFPVATYSGMLPGVLSGQYAQEQMEIDLVRLCRSANCRLIVDEVSTVDRAARQIVFAHRAPLPYDVLSIGIGSVPLTTGVEFAADAPLEMIKPMPTFLKRLTQRLEDLAARASSRVEAVIVGGGVGGIEIGCCLRTRLRRLFPSIPVQVTLIAGKDFAGGTVRSTQRCIRQALRQFDIGLIEKRQVRRVGRASVELDDGTAIQADLVLWATSATAPELLRRIDLPKDGRGFLLTRPTLQAVEDDSIFAVGDSGSLAGRATPKAGVFAVRQGPILWDNIGRYLARAPLVEYRPQTNFLKLINTGDGRAIGEYSGRASWRPLMWKIKNRIDVGFMRKYQDYRPMRRLLSLESEPPEMRCQGCGGKVAAASLHQALCDLDTAPSSDVLVGLAAPDDAAVIACPEKQVTVTVDFFAAPFNDPFLLGRVAAVHAASDCFAMGAAPTSALAIVQVPLGHPRGQQRVLRELLAGANAEFRRIGAAIVGGHTIEGPTTLLGFTVLARQVVAPLLKSGLKSGDRLILTKPLGTGVLLAAHMRNRCQGAWFVELCRQMAQGNEICLELAKRYSLAAMTDVTGFGLVGHLLELLDASQLHATLQLANVPLLPGSLELASRGIESTLAPANRAAESRIGISAPQWDPHRYGLLFDPQTSGGMLLAVPPRDELAILNELIAAGYTQARAIGTVGQATSRAAPRIDIVG